jgi:Ca2+-dependent lipid-binding protein
MNPFYKIFLWGYMSLSKPCRKGGENPSWDQTLNIKFNEDYLNNEMKIEIWDEKSLGENDILGSALINLDTLQIFEKNKQPKQWFDIFIDGATVGKVLMNIEWRN